MQIHAQFQSIYYPSCRLWRFQVIRFSLLSNLPSLPFTPSSTHSVFVSTFMCLAAVESQEGGKTFHTWDWLCIGQNTLHISALILFDCSLLAKSVYVCVCMCVEKRERERGRKRQRKALQRQRPESNSCSYTTHKTPLLKKKPRNVHVKLAHVHLDKSEVFYYNVFW